MFFSVIVPIYNAEKTLDRCLSSLQNQTLADFQVILMDDGSSDSSRHICMQFVQSDSRFRYFRQENQGVSCARNAGIRHSEGIYITFIDSDDVYCENYLEEFFKLICKYPENDSYWCGFEYISGDEKENGKKCLFSDVEEMSFIHRKNIMDLHEKTLEAALWNKVYKRSIIQDNHIEMPENLSLGEDLLFNYAYLDRCASPEIVFLNKCLYGYYCFSSESLNRKYRADLKEIYEELNVKTLGYLEKWDVSKDQMVKQYNCMYYRMDSVLRNTFREENRLSRVQKYKINNAILRGTEFQTILRMANCRIHPLYRLAYILRSYRVVRMVDFLAKVVKGR